MLSIIIPVFNQHEMTSECINALREHTQDFELIIVDNGSEPPYIPPFTGFIETLHIRNDENKGFPAAVNQGIRAAKGDVIALVNNDVIVTPGWAEKLISAINDGFSIVGPVTNYCAGLQKVQDEIYHSREELDHMATDRSEALTGIPAVEVNFIIGFVMVFPRSLFDEIGEFDESMWPCSGEEVDFCFRARAAGHRIGIVQGCYVHHEGSRTFQEMQDSGVLDYREVCRKVDAHIEEKWGADYWSRQAIDSSPAPKGLCLNLGCGLKHAHIQGAVNIDNRSEVNPDLVCDIAKGLPYSDNSVDMIYALDFIEHLERHEVIKLMDEIHRVLKPGGRFYHRTPSEEGRGAWQDPTHKSAWNINTWKFYFVDPAYRALYGTKANFSIIDLHDEWTDEENMILHTHCTYEAIK